MSVLGLNRKPLAKQPVTLYGKTIPNMTTQYGGIGSQMFGSRGQAKGGAEGDAKPGAVALGVTEAPLQPTPDSAQADTIRKLGRSVRTATDFVKTKGRAAKELLGG